MDIISKLKLSFLFLLLIGLAACGPNAEEQAAIERHKMDSIATVTKQAMEQKAQLEAEIEGASNRLIAFKADLEVAKSDMNRIQEFQFLRTGDERNQQIHDKSIEIQNLEKEIANTEQTILENKNRLEVVKLVLSNH